MKVLRKLSKALAWIAGGLVALVVVALEQGKESGWWDDSNEQTFIQSVWQHATAPLLQTQDLSNEYAEAFERANAGRCARAHLLKTRCQE